MPRLPIPNDDEGQWGQILNEFLSISHNTDGSLKAAAQNVVSVAGRTGSITLAQGDIPNLTTDLAARPTLTAADARFARTVNNTAPDANGNIAVPTVPSTAIQYVSSGAGIQAALDAQNSGTGGIIMLGKGTYTINTALVLYSGSTIVGQGVTRTILNYTGTGGSAIVSSTPATRTYAWNLSGFSIENNGTGTTGITMAAVSRAVIRDVVLDTFPTGIALTGDNGYSVYNRLDNVMAISSTTVGFKIGGAGCNSNTFANCRTNLCTLAAQVIDSNQNSFITCQFESGTDGIRLTATSNALSDSNSVISCRFENLTGTRCNVSSSFVRYTNIIGNAWFGSGLADVTDNGTRSLIVDSFYGVQANPVTKPVITGSKGGNVALQSLITALANAKIITDSTT